MVFGQKNYLYLVISLTLIVLGYGAMRAENAVDGVISLYIAPIMILGGYLGVIYAVLWRSKTEDDETAEVSA